MLADASSTWCSYIQQSKPPKEAVRCPCAAPCEISPNFTKFRPFCLPGLPYSLVWPRARPPRVAYGRGCLGTPSHMLGPTCIGKKSALCAHDSCFENFGQISGSNYTLIMGRHMRPRYLVRVRGQWGSSLGRSVKVMGASYDLLETKKGSTAQCDGIRCFDNELFLVFPLFFASVCECKKKLQNKK